MKKFYLFILFVLSHSYFCIAQQNQEQTIQVLKMAFITKEINLTPEEAQSFWPVYNKYFAEIKKARADNPNDELAFEEKVVNIRKKYQGDFKSILKDNFRVNKVFTAENNYRQLLRNELIRRQQLRRGGHPY